MFGLSAKRPGGVLRRGWSAAVDEYAIAGGWLLRSEMLMVCDAVGGVYAFDGKSGAPKWSQRTVHEDGVLAVAVRPHGTMFATAGQDGRVLIWGADGQIRQSIHVDKGWVDNVAWSPDGQWLAASCSRQVYVYGVDGVEVWRSDTHPSTVSALAWSSAKELAT
ncbi:MAG: WD40 repeat domain-containing protein, partial [Myxococcota bacterium]